MASSFSVAGFFHMSSSIGTTSLGGTFIIIIIIIIIITWGCHSSALPQPGGPVYPLVSVISFDLPGVGGSASS